MKYIINKGFIQQRVGKKLVIFNEEQSMLYTLNETAVFIFKQLKQGKLETEIIDSVTKRFAVGQRRVKKDFQHLLEDLLTKKVIIAKTD